MKKGATTKVIALAAAVLSSLLMVAGCSSTSKSSAGSPPSPVANTPASSDAGSSSASAASPGTAPSGTAPVSQPSSPFPKLTVGTPGIPPVISSTLPYIADKKGFYKAFGVDVTVKNFKTGTDAVRALSTGQLDLAITPPAQAIKLYAQGVHLVAVQGQEKPDWAIVSTDPGIQSCKDLKGQSLGVDAIGGIRYIALAQLLKTCGLTIKDVHALVFPGNQNPQAVLAGQLKTSVLHLNEAISIEHHGKKLHDIMTMADAVPDTMYEFFSVQQSKLQSLRPALVRFVAAQIAALNWMFDPANADEVAQLESVVGDNAAVMKDAMAKYKEIGFWTLDGSGLPLQNINNMIENQVKVGNVPKDKAPTGADLFDNSIYDEASKLVQP